MSNPLTGYFDTTWRDWNEQIEAAQTLVRQYNDSLNQALSVLEKALSALEKANAARAEAWSIIDGFKGPWMTMSGPEYRRLRELLDVKPGPEEKK